jgi:hypothetical protein
MRCSWLVAIFLGIERANHMTSGTYAYIQSGSQTDGLLCVCKPIAVATQFSSTGSLGMLH